MHQEAIELISKKLSALKRELSNCESEDLPCKNLEARLNNLAFTYQMLSRINYIGGNVYTLEKVRKIVKDNLEASENRDYHDAYCRGVITTLRWVLDLLSKVGST